MRKIKPKEFKPPRRFNLNKADVDFVYCLPIEGVLFQQAEYERHDKENTWNIILANLRGEPVEPQPNYLAEVSL